MFYGNGLEISPLNDFTKMLSVSPEASGSYRKKVSRLVDHVIDELEANPKIHHLIGGNPFELVRDNLINHANFMSTVLSLNSSELLAMTIPWFYRVCRARDFSFDYFQIERAAWKNAVNECLDNTHSIEINKVYDLMTSDHNDMILNSIKDEWLTYFPKCEPSEMQDILLALVLIGDSKECLKLANQSVQTEDDLKHFYINVICPIMYRIGLLWEKNVISVAEEHLSTAIIGRISASLYARFANVEIYRGKAVVTAGPNEFHEVGVRMFADFLEMDGWDVTYLGANTPSHEIVKILKRHKPFMVALSVATVFNLDNVRHAIEDIKADQDTKDTKVMVGGFAFNGLPNLWNDFGADGFADDATKATLVANKWWDERVG